MRRKIIDKRRKYRGVLVTLRCVEGNRWYYRYTFAGRGYDNAGAMSMGDAPGCGNFDECFREARWEIDRTIKLEEDFFPNSIFLENVKKDAWFNENGILIRRIQKDCIDQLSRPGKQDENVKKWVNKLGFYVPDKMAHDYIKSLGAMDNPKDYEKYDAYNEFILWDICCTKKEHPRHTIDITAY